MAFRTVNSKPDTYEEFMKRKPRGMTADGFLRQLLANKKQMRKIVGKVSGK